MPDPRDAPRAADGGSFPELLAAVLVFLLLPVMCVAWCVYRVRRRTMRGWVKDIWEWWRGELSSIP